MMVSQIGEISAPLDWWPGRDALASILNLKEGLQTIRPILITDEENLGLVHCDFQPKCWEAIC